MSCSDFILDVRPDISEIGGSRHERRMPISLSEPIILMFVQYLKSEVAERGRRIPISVSQPIRMRSAGGKSAKQLSGDMILRASK